MTGDLKRLNRLQLRAVDDQRRHQHVKAFPVNEKLHVAEIAAGAEHKDLDSLGLGARLNINLRLIEHNYGIAWFPSALKFHALGSKIHCGLSFSISVLCLRTGMSAIPKRSQLQTPCNSIEDPLRSGEYQEPWIRQPLPTVPLRDLGSHRASLTAEWTAL
ncbi:hypothetical protein FI667_g15429, partial [Globisporangium splendens]